MERNLLAGAALGPAVFIACWLIGGTILPGYSPIEEPISRLAAIGTQTRPLMNVGLAVFAFGVGASAWPMRRVLGPKAAWAIGLNALLTLGVLATPLDYSPASDVAHGIFAGLAYVALAAVGVLGSSWLRRQNRFDSARGWLIVGVVTGVALLLSVTELAPGLLQRVGLTTTDLALIRLGLSGPKAAGAARPRPG